MDQNSWLWKKRSSEKALAADTATNFLICNEEEETEEILAEKAQVQRDIRILHDELSFALYECNSKNNTAKKQVKIAQEAIAGWEKAEAEAISLKKDLDKVLQQKAACEERLRHLEAALKECMQQLRFVREEQEKRVHCAVVKKSEEFEKARIVLDEKLAQASKKLVKLDAEHAQLNKALSGKGKTIEELRKYQAQAEADFSALMSRVESTEKENASLKYEVRVLEKELDIRNEEREFNLRTADIAHKQHQESVKKIAELESECQRLRLLVRKRLPGPAAVTKMKNEIEMLEKGQVETRRRKSNPSLLSSVDLDVDVSVDTPSKRINFPIAKLGVMESGLQFTRTMYPRSPSRLSRGLSSRQVKESLKVRTSSEPGKQETLSDLGSDEKASTCAESWASALISELEHFKNEKQLGTPSHAYMVMGTPDMNLMDDFEEMEKLAVVSVNFPGGSSHHPSEEGNGRIFGPSGSPLGSPKPKPISEMVPVQIDDLLKLILEHCQELQRNPHQVLDDMKVALEHNTLDAAVFNGKASMNHPDASDSPQLGFQTSPNISLISDASDTGNDDNISTTKKIDRNVSASIHKILELLNEINMKSKDNCVAESSRNKNSATPAEYICRAFQWKTAQFSSVLQQFVQTCNDLLNGTADVGQFIRLVASTLDRVMNHCFSLQDISSIKNTIRTHIDWDESRSESRVDSGSANQSSESSRQREDVSYLPLNGQNSSFDTEPNAKEEAERLNVQPQKKQSSVMVSEDGLLSQIVKSEGSKDIIDNLQSGMEAMTMKQSKGNTGDQIEKQEITETNLEWSNDLENDLENNNNNYNNNDNSSIKGLEETSNDLKILLKSKTSKGVTDDGKPSEKQLRNDWEITAASEKLAECQETILNLGKQLKALASPGKAALFDKAISAPADNVVTSISISTSERNVSRRLSLLENMLAEDNNRIDASPRTKDDNDDIQNGSIDSAVNTNAATESQSKFADPRDPDRKAVIPMAIVPRKKTRVTSLLKKLFWRQKKGNSKRTALS